ncbi:MAG: aminopeptidase P family N-terminal domain-containing protein, partial [Oscillospiraceae bacterium]|nr:aminopeptidase P family N-terminal domain-containing protein [Oscillospiraceae bacterium]
MNMRLQKVIGRMKDRGLTQLLISDPGSVYYLTGISVDPGERFLGLIVRESGDATLIVNRLFSVHETDIQTV